MGQRKKVAPEGAGVFQPTAGDVRPVVRVRSATKVLKCRMAGGRPIQRDLTPDEYAGGSPRAEDTPPND